MTIIPKNSTETPSNINYPSSIKIQESLPLTIGQEKTLSVTYVPDNSIKAVTWSISDPSIASIEDGVVHVKLLGACAGCSMMDFTLKDGIEEILVSEIPEVKAVVNDAVVEE